MMHSDIVELLWQSTDELHGRFGKFPPNSTETLMVFQEECREFEEAVRSTIYPPDDYVREVCLEAADVVVTILATLSARGISREQFAAYAAAVARKNDAKTTETHTINPVTGKIQRIK